MSIFFPSFKTILIAFFNNNTFYLITIANFWFSDNAIIFILGYVFLLSVLIARQINLYHKDSIHICMC